MLTLEERKEWVRRGFKDPKRAYNDHASGAGQRGIEFKLTFAEWWQIWEPHYERRGRASGCLVMCRTGDVGPYAVGNVRIATVKENAQEAALERLTAKGRILPAYRQITPPATDSWLWRRNVFAEYSENEQESS